MGPKQIWMCGDFIMAEGKGMGGSQQPSAAGWLVSHCLTALFFLSYGKRGRRTSSWITLSSTRVFLSHSFSYIFILAAAYQAGLRHLGLIWRTRSPQAPTTPRSYEGWGLAPRLTSRNMDISCCNDSSKIAIPGPALTRSSGSGIRPPVRCWNKSGTWREETIRGMIDADPFSDPPDTVTHSLPDPHPYKLFCSTQWTDVVE